MHKRLRLFWGLLFALSVGWMAGGALLTSGAVDGGQAGDDLAQSIQSVADGANVALPPGLPMPALFLLTGAPFALLSLYFFWRNQRALGARAAAASSAPNLRRQTILIALASLVFGLLLWNAPRASLDAPGPSLVLYPVRLFVTFVHEAGHSLAALLTGGEVIGFTVSPDGSGLATTRGGNISLILPAGYLGAALFGSLLFFLSNRMPRWTRGLSFLIGIAIIALTLAFAMPDAAGNSTALIIGIGFGVAMMALAWWAPRTVNLLALNTLATLTGLNAVFDLWSLVGKADSASGEILNDAAAFASQVTPLLSASMVAFIWAAVAVGMVAFSFYAGLIKQVSGEINDAVNGNRDYREPASA